MGIIQRAIHSSIHYSKEIRSIDCSDTTISRLDYIGAMKQDDFDYLMSPNLGTPVVVTHSLISVLQMSERKRGKF